MSSILQEYKPSRSLNAFVQAYWTGDFNRNSESGFSQSVVPNGCIELIIHLSDDHCALSKHDAWDLSPEFTLIGLFTTSYEVRFGTRVKVFGIRFYPDGIHNIFGIPPGHFLGSYEDCRAVFGRQLGDYCSRLRDTRSLEEKIALTETFLTDNLRRHQKQFDYTGLAAGIIRRHQGLLALEALKERVPISQRQLQREFKIRYGLSPKAYTRLARLNAIQLYMQQTSVPDYSDLAYSHGFADQSHFIREFKLLTGNNPGAFAREREKFIVNPGIPAATSQK